MRCRCLTLALDDTVDLTGAASGDMQIFGFVLRVGVGVGEEEEEEEGEGERKGGRHKNDDDIDSVEYSKILGAVPVDNQIIELTGYRPRLFLLLSLEDRLLQPQETKLLLCLVRYKQLQ